MTRQHPQAPTGRWLGHMPEASAALAPLLERAATGRCEFNATERALFMAGEFWVAVETRALVRHLGADPGDGLRYQGLVYGAMGAQGVCRALVFSLRELSASSAQVARRRCLEALQERLGNTRDPVDTLIAELAGRLGLSATPPEVHQAATTAIRMFA